MKSKQNQMLFISFCMGWLILWIFLYSDLSQAPKPEYKIKLIDQNRVCIESTAGKKKDTINFNNIQNWIEKDNE